MPLNQQVKLSIRIPQLELRRIKSLAVLRGVTLQQAVRRALEAWAAQPQQEEVAPPPGPLARAAASTGETAKAGKAERAAPSRPRAATCSRQRSQADAGPAGTRAGAGQAPQRAPRGPWISRAAKLDWSKCPLVESAPGKDDNIWVLRGTPVPLASVLIAVDEGHPLLEISHAYKISMQFLLAVLQYVATPAKPPAAGG